MLRYSSFWGFRVWGAFGFRLLGFRLKGFRAILGFAACGVWGLRFSGLLATSCIEGLYGGFCVKA